MIVNFLSVGHTSSEYKIIWYLGFLGGAEDYWTHTYEDGLDLYENTQLVRDESGTYSTHLFTSKVISIIETHNSNKVGISC